MKRVGAIAALLLALGTPAAAQTAEENYQAGIAARRAQNFEEAERLLQRAVAQEPENSDIHLELGYVYLATDRLDDAEAAFRRVLELAPGYDDAHLSLARVLRRRGNRSAALAELDLVTRDDEYVQQLRTEILTGDPNPWRWRIDVDGAYAQVDGQPDWLSAAMLVQHRPSPSTIVAFLSEATRRLDRTDVYAEARIDHQFVPGNNVYLLVGGTPEADHRARWQIGAGASVRVHEGDFATVLKLDLRLANYPSGDIHLVTPGLEQYLGGRFWVTAQWINVWDRFRHEAGWLARADFMPTERLRFFAGAADAPDLSEGVVVETLSLFGGVSADVSDRTTLRLTLAHDDPEGPSDRLTLSLGLGLRF